MISRSGFRTDTEFQGDEIAMEPFTPFLTLLAEIEDPRRAEGKLYRLPHVMLFAIMAIVAGANSYRTIHTFIDVHLARLREAFHLPWRRAPAYTTIRGIIQQVEADSIEQVFRRHAAILHEQTSPAKRCPVAIDGKVLRRSFDGFHDRKAAHILSAFATDAALVLAHADCDDKSNEIPAVQTLLSELGLAGALMTVDALHCQKNIRAGCGSRRSRHRPGQGQSAYPAPAHCRTVPAHGTSGSDPDSGSEAAIPR